jgi:hypothetical protein
VYHVLVLVALPSSTAVPYQVPGTLYREVFPSLLTDFKISNFVTFSYSGSMKDNREVFHLHIPGTGKNKKKTDL